MAGISYNCDDCKGRHICKFMDSIIKISALSDTFNLDDVGIEISMEVDCAHFQEED